MTRTDMPIRGVGVEVGLLGEVDALLAQGYYSAEIAERMGRSRSWVTWARHILEGRNVVRTRSAAWIDRQRWLMRRGVIP